MTGDKDWGDEFRKANPNFTVPAPNPQFVALPPKVTAAAQSPIVQQLALRGAKAIGRKIAGWFRRAPAPPSTNVPIVEVGQNGVTTLEPPPAKHRPRIECPLCARDVAVTADGLTFSHRIKPGTRDPAQHIVRVADGVEVSGPKVNGAAS